jgi:hypothetical protein
LKTHPRRGGNRKGKYSMDFAPIIADVKAAKCAGFRYQRAGHQRYRDRVTVYRDGRLLFERFCYGEAAGLVFKLWAPGADDTGVPQWDFSKCNVTNARDEVPHQLTGAGQGGLVFDGRPARWECVDKLKNDKANGYGGPVNFFKNLFGGRK